MLVDMEGISEGICGWTDVYLQYRYWPHGRIGYLSTNQVISFFVQGMTPLLEAAAHGHVDAVRVMVELKANPTVSANLIDS